MSLRTHTAPVITARSIYQLIKVGDIVSEKELKKKVLALIWKHNGWSGRPEDLGDERDEWEQAGELIALIRKCGLPKQESQEYEDGEVVGTLYGAKVMVNKNMKDGEILIKGPNADTVANKILIKLAEHSPTPKKQFIVLWYETEPSDNPGPKYCMGSSLEHVESILKALPENNTRDIRIFEISGEYRLSTRLEKIE